MAYVKNRANRRALPYGEKRSKKFSIDTSELDRMIENIEQTPKEVSQHVRKRVLPTITAMIEQVWLSETPSGNSEDRSKWSQKHRSIWSGVPPLKNIVGSAVRNYGAHFTAAFVGYEYPHGNKSYFDYHGQVDRMMSFWAGGPDRRSGKPRAISDKNYRARPKVKRWVAQVVHDRTYKSALKMLEVGIQDAIAGSLGDNNG